MGCTMVVSTAEPSEAGFVFRDGSEAAGGRFQIRYGLGELENGSLMFK